MAKTKKIINKKAQATKVTKRVISKKAAPKKATGPQPWVHDGHNFAILGSYALPQANAPLARGEGIRIFKINTKNGAMRLHENQPDPKIIGKSPTYVVFHPTVPVFYCTNEIAEGGFVRAIKFDPRTFKCSLLSKETSNGGAPCHLMMSNDGKWLFSATYVGQSTLMYPVNKDGSLGKLCQQFVHEDVPSTHWRQGAAHAHSTYVFERPNRPSCVLVPDLGTDRLYVYDFDGSKAPSKALTRGKNQEYCSVPIHSGPRHVWPDKAGNTIYMMNEMSHTVSVFKFSKQNTLTLVQTISANFSSDCYDDEALERLYPDNFGFWSHAAHIMVTPDDKHVMITNRGHNSFCIFDRNSKTGLLKYNNHCFTGGQHPRSFDISPKGDLVVVSNQDDDRINAFKRNAKTGQLTPTATTIMKTPAYIKLFDTKTFAWGK